MTPTGRDENPLAADGSVESPDVPGVTDDPVLRLLYEGRATSLHQAEELYLDSALDEIGRLVAGPLDNDALLRHPLLQLLAAHGGRGWEDSVL